jgi:hypothetical protein
VFKPGPFMLTATSLEGAPDHFKRHSFRLYLTTNRAFDFLPNAH